MTAVKLKLQLTDLTNRNKTPVERYSLECQKVIRVFFGFALLRLVIETFSANKEKNQNHIIASSFDWANGLFCVLCDWSE